MIVTNNYTPFFSPNNIYIFPLFVNITLMYYIAVAVVIIALLIWYHVFREESFCLYDKPIYYPTYRGLKARDYNVRCTAYCSAPDSPCVVWCN